MGAGAVWLESGEDAAMAAALDMSLEAFRERHVRTLPHPATGELQESLREEGSSGRCVLLEGENHCSVYADRPRQCSEFPFWSSIEESPAALERARAICPGIELEPEPEAAERAQERLAELYEEVDAFVQEAAPVCIVRGVCCRFEEADHRLYATALEADYAARLHPEAPPPEAPGRCPYHVAGRCTAREGRPLGCRTYFCDARTQSVLEEAHEHFLLEIRRIEAESNYPKTYAPFPSLLAARGIGEGGPPQARESETSRE